MCRAQPRRFHRGSAIGAHGTRYYYFERAESHAPELRGDRAAAEQQFEDHVGVAHFQRNQRQHRPRIDRRAGHFLERFGEAEGHTDRTQSELTRQFERRRPGQKRTGQEVRGDVVQWHPKTAVASAFTYDSGVPPDLTKNSSEPRMLASTAAEPPLRNSG